jgi:hypothetical protein
MAMTSSCSDPCGEVAQIRLGGEPVIAPFTGTIKRFRVQGADGKFRLQVLRERRNHHKRYKALRQSAVSTASVGRRQVASFPTSLRIRKGDYVGLVHATDGTSLSTMKAGKASCFRWFFYAISVGSSARSLYPCESGVALYNARLVR